MTKTIAIGLVLIASCLKANPNYVAGDGNQGSDAGSDAMPPQCMGNSGCSADTPICNLVMGPGYQTCEACGSDADCASVASGPTCLPNGACAGDDQIAYVGSGGDNGNGCTQLAPCKTIARALTVGKPYVLLDGSAADDGVSIAQAVTLLGRDNAAIVKTSTGDVVSINSAGAAVGVYDMELTDGGGLVYGDGVSATAASGPVTLEHVNIHAVRFGIVANSALIAHRSTIAHNGGGGISVIAASFDIENCFIFSNGTTGSSLFGGISIVGSPNTSDTVAFTTIVNNHAAAGAVGGITCTNQTVALIHANVIIANNDANGTAETAGANCAYTYSDFYPAGALQAGSNLALDPSFAGSASENFHLGSGSPLIDQAQPSATLRIDIDGQSRPQGSGRDIGADEYMH